MKRHPLLLSVAVVVVVGSTAACATATDGDPTGSVTIVETPGATGEPDEPVMHGHPEPNWDAPVVGGVEVTAETAQEVARAAFDVYVPTLPNGTLLLIQATDPAQYPEDFRGYGVLYDVTTEDGPVVRLFIEETPVGVGEEDLAREMATNNGRASTSRSSTASRLSSSNKVNRPARSSCATGSSTTCTDQRSRCRLFATPSPR